MGKPNNHVPQEITYQILPRLPVKTLMRFKCVCKSWRSLVSSPPFTRNHFERESSQNPKTIDLKLLISLPCGFKTLALEKSFDVRTSFTRRSFCPDEYYTILGSCHGLVCLWISYIPDFLLLWNPSTGESKQLPGCRLFPHDSEWFLNLHYYGFGYDSSSDDYKILLEINKIVVIFSLAKNSWRMLDQQCLGSNCNRIRGVYSNGALHWQLGHTIISFDLRSEIFRLGPRVDSLMSHHRRKFVGIGENLYCIKEVKQCSSDVKFLLMEYCLEGCWKNFLNFAASEDFHDFLRHFLCISKDNELIIEDGLDIIRIGAEGRIVEKIRLCNSAGRSYECWSSPHPFDAITYVETLISPNRFS